MRSPTPQFTVLFVTRQARCIGGLERYVVEVASALRAQNIRCELLFDANLTPQPDPTFVSVFDALWPLVDVQSQVEAIKPDVLFVHQVPEHFEEIEFSRTGRPVVRFVHDHADICPRAHKYRPFANTPCTHPLGSNCLTCVGPRALLAVPRLKRRIRHAQAARRTVVGSQYMAEVLTHHGFDAAKVDVNPLFSAAQPVEPLSPQISTDLMFAGLLSTGKGLHILLRAMSRMRYKASLKVLGDGPQRQALEAIAKHLGLFDRVHFLGRVTSDLVFQHLASSKILVQPSITPETFALSGMEGAMFGRTVVASRVGGIGTWLEHGRTGFLVPPGDAAALADCLDTQLSHDDMRSRFERQSRARLAHRFGKKAHVDRLIEIFRHAMHSTYGARTEVLDAA